MDAQKKAEIANKQHQIELKKAREAREMKFRNNVEIKMDREAMMENVAALIIKHVLSAELYINAPTEGASLFNESNFIRYHWNI